MRKKPREHPPRPRGRKSRLEELIGRALEGTETEEEQEMAFHETLLEQLRLPFRTGLADGPVSVVGVETGADDELVAVCLRSGERREVPLSELPIPRPAPRGAEWIRAYRHWRQE
jgi:hypothetical protein